MTKQEKPRTVPKAREGRTLRFDRATGTLTITLPVRGRMVATRYRVAEYDADFGRAFAVVKLDGDGEPVVRYDVSIGGRPEDHICDCTDFLKHGRPCKHCDALAFLVETGRVG